MSENKTNSRLDSMNANDNSNNRSATGYDVTEQALDSYNTEIDQEAVNEIRKEWKENRKNRRLSPMSAIVMLSVVGILPWYVYGQRQDIAYFFSPSEPMDLGSAQDYRITENGEINKPEQFEDNRYATVRGIPMQHVTIKEGDSKIISRSSKYLYQLLGSSIYVQEESENSRFANFMAHTSSAYNLNDSVEELQVSGRLRLFGKADVKKYAPIREYFAKNYGTVFCESLTPADRKRRESMLGHGGVALQIMPDGAVIQAETETRATLTDVEPLRGRSVMAIGSDNTIIHSIDGGLTWRKSQLPLSSQVTSIAHSPSSEQIIFSGRKGWIGSESYSPDPKALSISQDVLDVVFTDPEPGDNTSPRIISVGREGLIQTAYINREGWFPSHIDDNYTFNDILRTRDKWFVAGQMLMHRGERDTGWTRAVMPEKTEWMSLTEIPGAVVATGKKGAIARYDLNAPKAQWETWESDDVPGIDYTENLNASAISGDGKTWVAVGSNGAIVVAKADENGSFSRPQRISGSYASYGVVRDILAGNSVEASLYEALKRYTPEEFYDVTWHDGVFYAVGTNSLFMTSADGLSWKKRQLHIKNKDLRSIVFNGPKTGVIAGEKGTMLITEDNGETWRSKKLSTERSIYDLAVFKDGFVFAGAFGLWGYCEGTAGRCYVRARTDSHNYRAIALDNGEQKPGFLHIVAAGSNSHIDRIDDAPNNAEVKTSLFAAERSNVAGMAFASGDLPLRPNEPRGRIGLVAAGAGSIFRSYDGGLTFQREDTGMTTPIKKLAMTQNGDIAWAFDGNGVALEDIHGRGNWKPLPNSYVDGTFAQTIGYLIDENCVFRKMPNEDPKQVACVKAGEKLHDIAADGQSIIIGLYHGNVYTTAQLENDEIVVHDVVSQGRELSKETRLIPCAGEMGVFDLGKKQLIRKDDVLENVSDAACVLGNLTALTSQLVRPGVWQVFAQSEDTVWSMEVGFDPTSAHFAKAGGDWWLAAEAPDSSEPLILLSHDGKSWSWRRNNITDFHAVAVAGSKAVTVGDKATILVSDNYGATWSPVTTKATQTLRDVCLSSDGSFGLAVGDAGLIYRSQENLNYWSKLKYKLEFDITSCTIADRPDGIQIYFGGKGGAIYSTNKDMGRLDLVESPALEDIYSLTTLETGEVIAVGGVYQDPSTVCENGYLIEADSTPKSMWLTVLIAAVLALVWFYTIYKLINGIRNTFKSKKDEDSE